MVQNGIEWYRMVLNGTQWLRMVSNGAAWFRPSGKNRQNGKAGTPTNQGYRTFKPTRQCGPTVCGFGAPCETLRIFANRCETLRNVANRCETLRIVANLCVSLRTYLPGQRRPARPTRWRQASRRVFAFLPARATTPGQAGKSLRSGRGNTGWHASGCPPTYRRWAGRSMAPTGNRERGPWDRKTGTSSQEPGARNGRSRNGNNETRNAECGTRREVLFCSQLLTC